METIVRADKKQHTERQYVPEQYMYMAVWGEFSTIHHLGNIKSRVEERACAEQAEDWTRHSVPLEISRAASVPVELTLEIEK